MDMETVCIGFGCKMQTRNLCDICRLPVCENCMVKHKNETRDH